MGQNICDFSLNPEQLGDEIGEGNRFENIYEWEIGRHAFSCIRETWGGTQYCIWHAEIDAKPVGELVQAQTGWPERLEFAYFAGCDIGSVLSLSGLRLWNANFQNANLEGIDLSDSLLIRADFSGANLSNADFSDSFLPGADFTGANMRGVKMSRANLRRCNFTNSELVNATVQDANLERANLNKSILRRVNLSDSSLDKTDLSGAILRKSILDRTSVKNSDLSGTNFRSAKLTQADLYNSNLTSVDMKNAILDDAILHRTDCTKINLEDSSLIRADLREADLRGALLNQCFLADTRINNLTKFDDMSVYESGSDHAGRDLNAAVWTYRRLEHLHRAHALSDQTRHFHVRKQEAERKRDWIRGKYGKASISTLNKYLTNHGESLMRLLSWWIGTIIIFGLMYPFSGGIEDRVGDQTYVFSANSLSDLFSPDGFEIIGRSLYFSTITFTTIGYANVAPHGAFSRILVGVESLIGSILIALFVYVLGRRVSR